MNVLEHPYYPRQWYNHERGHAATGGPCPPRPASSLSPARAPPQCLVRPTFCLGHAYKHTERG